MMFCFNTDTASSSHMRTVHRVDSTQILTCKIIQAAKYAFLVLLSDEQDVFGRGVMCKGSLMVHMQFSGSQHL